MIDLSDPLAVKRASQANRRHRGRLEMISSVTFCPRPTLRVPSVQAL
jgi:hypothetical protein